VQAGAPVGLLLATGAFGLVSMLPEPEFLAWGWRIPFLLGVVLTGVGLFLRLKVLESPIFARMLEEKPAAGLPVLEVLRRHPRNVVLAMGARVAENGFYYFFTVFSLSYGEQQLGLPRGVLLRGVLLAAVVHLFATLAFGALSDRVGRRPVYLGGAVFLAAFAFPYFWLIQTRQAEWVWLAVVVGMVGHAAMYGPQAAFLAEMFPTRMRYSGVSLAYQVTSIFAGSLAPLIAAALLQATGSGTPIAIYVAAAALVTGVAALLARETKGKTFAEIDAEA
jgi:MFS family permease